MKPEGGDEHRREDGTPSPTDNLMERILSRPNMQMAWQRVKRNGGAPGVDGMTVDDFPAFAREHWPEIRSAVEEGRYRPSPVRRVEIPKPDGGRRQLGLALSRWRGFTPHVRAALSLRSGPTVLDRVIQQAVAQVLTPIFDPGFSDHSYGFRPKRSAHQAVRQVQSAIREGYAHAVDADLSKFFDRVNHDILMERVARQVRDSRSEAETGRRRRQ